MIMAVMAMDVLTFGSSYLQMNLLNEMFAGVDIPDIELDNNDLREGVIGVIYTIVYFVSGIIYIRWFRRAYWNLHTQTNKLRYTEGWAAGAWFVPFLNLFRPYHIMKELYTVTDDLLRANDGIRIGRKNFAILGTWWTFWIISAIIDQISFRLINQMETAEEFLLSSQVEMVSAAVNIPLGFIAIKVVKDYAAMEHKLYRRRKNGDGPLLDLSGDSSVIDTFI